MCKVHFALCQNILSRKFGWCISDVETTKMNAQVFHIPSSFLLSSRYNQSYFIFENDTDIVTSV